MAKSTNRSATKPDENVATIHDQELVRGNGGELHQIAEGDIEILTTAQGGPVADDQNTMKFGERGPAPEYDEATYAEQRDQQRIGHQ